MRKALALALLTALALPFTSSRTEAQGLNFVPYLGYNFDGEAFLVGVGAEFDAPFSAGTFALGIRPTIEYIFVDDVTDNIVGSSIDISTTLLQINGDVITRLNAQGFSPFVGAGLAIVYASADVSCDGSDLFCSGVDEGSASNTDLGLNVLGGLEFPGALGFGDPFVQARITFADGTALSVLGGLIIALGAN